MSDVNSPPNKDDSEEDFHNTHRPTENLIKIELIGTKLRVNYDGTSTIATTSHRVKSTEEKAEIRLQDYISVCEKPATSKEYSTSTTYKDKRQAGTFPSSSRSSRILPSLTTKLFNNNPAKKRAY